MHDGIVAVTGTVGRLETGARSPVDVGTMFSGTTRFRARTVGRASHEFPLVTGIFGIYAFYHALNGAGGAVTSLLTPFSARPEEPKVDAQRPVQRLLSRLGKRPSGNRLFGWIYKATSISALFLNKWPPPCVPEWQHSLAFARTSGIMIGKCNEYTNSCHIDVSAAVSKRRKNPDIDELLSLGMPEVFDVNCSTDPARACSNRGDQCAWTNKPVQGAHCATHIPAEPGLASVTDEKRMFAFYNDKLIMVPIRAVETV
ncbi:cis-golgi transport protein particle complex subunit [Purpureocillium lavendulum]|uniref:Cis-golgi transport protein particle complex subunit n=1 Tax=Purpureocillium lavendulum TaxID=1247861 RepID=A0AB34G3S1_9HYPO|nr:cis-golgi transport protein particle complex subunit [Purpureocillium lavendulum]